MRVFRILFALEGRINRLEFWLGLAIIATFTALMFTAVRHVYAIGGQTGRVMAALVFCAWLFVFGWTLVAVSTKRWHDMDLSGLMSLLWLIPLAGPPIVIGWLGFVPGKGARRRHRSRSSQLSGTRDLSG
jgi:uncharacterized membrane protein YhaH (DUF805 family)